MNQTTEAAIDNTNIVLGICCPIGALSGNYVGNLASSLKCTSYPLSLLFQSDCRISTIQAGYQQKAIKHIIKPNFIGKHEGS
jgi:hypothetical protein